MARRHRRHRARVALLPMLGIGGMQLYKAETAGPLKDERLTPRLARTARDVCGRLFLLTAACAVSYWLAGMSAFDADRPQLLDARDGRASRRTTPASRSSTACRSRRRDRLHADRRHQLQRALHRVAHAAAAALRPGHADRAFLLIVVVAIVADDARAGRHAHLRHRSLSRCAMRRSRS